MKQIREAPWIVIVEDGDTPENIAAWIEQNAMPDNDGKPSVVPYEKGDVQYGAWYIDPHPGDVLVFCTPAPRSTSRYPGWVKELDFPMSQEEREALEYIRTKSWKTPRRTFTQWKVDMSTMVRNWFREEQ